MLKKKIMLKRLEFGISQFVPKKYLFKKRLKRSIKNEYEPELNLIKNLIKNNTHSIYVEDYKFII